jgi:RNA polymerase sigma factor (sigma-70 family)
MPTDTTRPLARQLFAAVLRSAEYAPTDQELLAGFVAGRDEESFAEIVRRHGAMVLSVCRRVTGQPQDAEDAFQAAFLVLARRAAQIGRPELLGNWLYGVAYRTALEARAARRRVKEQQPVSAVPEPAAPESPEDTADLRRVIDEELARLPDKYRAAVVLCDLEGVSRKDAAEKLRVPEGTLSSRLAHARKVLAARLSRRGVCASGVVIATTLARDAGAAAVPTTVVHSTARAAARFAGGGAVPPEVVSSQVTTLTDGVIKAMIVNRLRLTLGAGILVAGLLGLGAAAGVGQQPRNSAPKAKPATTAVEPDDEAQPPKSKAKDKAKAPAEKVPAKGVEDDDVPYPGTPSQAVVRLEDGKLIVRQRSRGYHMVSREVDGTQVRRYEVKSTISAKTYDASDVSVFDMKGNRVADKTWKAQLKTDQHVLVAFDGRLPLPRELHLFKEDTLLIVFPGSSGAEAIWAPQVYGQIGNNFIEWHQGRFAPPAVPQFPPTPQTPALPGQPPKTPTPPKGPDDLNRPGPGP